MDFAAAYLEQTRAFGELIRGADPSAPVPTCPDWNLGQLFRHVGRGDRWAAQIVREKFEDRLDFRMVEDGKPPSGEDAISWLNDGAQLLIDAVEQSGAQTPVWTFLGKRPAGWWIRRRLHENAVHRADAAIAIGADFTLESEVAADGLDEWLERVVIQAASNGADQPVERGDTIHLHATDPGLGVTGEWTIGAGDAGVVWSHAHGKGSAALRGGVTELLLVTLRRTPLADTGVEFFGDEAVWRKWLDRTPL